MSVNTDTGFSSETDTDFSTDTNTKSTETSLA